MPTTVSIAIVNWNTRDLLRACLAALPWGSASLALDVVVVDNASHDGSVAMVRRDFPAVRVLRNRANLGFVRANNQALAAGRGEFRLMLNSDTETQPGSLERLVEVLAADPTVGAVGPRLLNSDGTWQDSAGPFPRERHRWLPGRFEHACQQRLRAHLDEGPQPVDWLCGAAVMTRRDVLARVGPLDERYYMWYDDVDWSRKVARAGLGRRFVGDAVVVHHGRQSGRRLATDVLAEQLLRSEYTYLRLNDGLAATWRAFGLRLGKAAVQAVVGGPEARREARARLRLHRRLALPFCLQPSTRWR